MANNLNNVSNNDALTIKVNNDDMVIPVIATEPFKYNKENILFLDLVAFYDYPTVNKLSEIDIKVEKQHIDAMKRALDTQFSNLYILSPDQHAKSAKKLSDSFSVNLIFLSRFAILVSILISYQFFNFISSSRQKHMKSVWL